MYFVIIARDKPPGDLRAKLRTSHLEFIADKQAQFRFGGPLIDDNGQVTGSLMILDLPDRAALDDYMAHDPYFRDGGIFETVTIHQTRWIVPEAIPGALAAEVARQKAVDATR